MKFLLSFIEFLLLITLTDGLFAKKFKKEKNQLIAAKYDPEMPVRVRNVLGKVGDNPIVKIQLGRTPVEAVFTLFLNLLSRGQFNKKKVELGYDEIYHNYLLVTISSTKKSSVLSKIIGSNTSSSGSQIFKLDKAQRIRLDDPTRPTDFKDIYNIPLTPNKTLTLNRLITTASNVDKHFYIYDAANNNMCQTFVENIIDINGLTGNILDETTRMALKPQDARALLATLKSRGDLVKKVTDLGAHFDKFIYDRDFHWKKSTQKEFQLLGDLHVKVNDPVSHTEIKEIVPSDGQTAVIDGTVETVFENTDKLYQAVVALEDNDTGSEIMKIVWIVLGVVAGVVVAGLVGYLILRYRKKKLSAVNGTSNVESTSDLNRQESTTSTQFDPNMSS